MHPSSPDASPALPAIVLALALLGVLAAVGGQVLVQMRMAPGTLLPAGAAAAVASITIVVTLAVAAIATLFARRLPKGTLPWMP